LDALELKLSDAVTLAVPASLDSITTYVLLEQETWFEKEMGFLRHWLRPGMTAIDIGANLGVYSLPIARLVGPEGRVFAYEPGSEPRGFLERSRELNGARNLEIASQALSDGEREGYLVFGGSSELSALGQGGQGEPVRITSLDAEDRVRGWPAPDFVKIDAEGEEERILAGGRDFFARYSPLVMFEIKAGADINERLRSIFPGIGYGLYRALTRAPLLVPLEPAEALDGFELNLFAAKPDRAQSLALGGFLADHIPAWEPGEDALRTALAPLMGRAFASGFPFLFDGSAALDPDYRKSLAAYAVWNAQGVPPPTRCAALRFAFDTLRALCAQTPTAARLATLARISWDWGQRGECVKALKTLLAMYERDSLVLSEPFWPACPRFDRVVPAGQAWTWFIVSAVEQFERAASFSSCFSGASSAIDWLCGQPFACAEMMRRRMLLAARAGQRPTVPKELDTPAHDHLNADIWRSGKVPGVAQGS
jgi:FkbM family methyltransferase